MQPLLYLTGRQLLNGVRRAVTTPKRLISLIAVVGYYVLFFVRPFVAARGAGNFGAGNLHLKFPPLGALDAIVFAGFAIISWVLAIGAFSNRASFRQADVDVLFATPVEPKVVLIYRILREYLFTLFVPFLLLLITYRPAAPVLQAIFADMPNREYAPYALKAVSAMWFLLSMAWVAVRYATSFFVGRSDLQSDRNQRIVSVGSWIFGLSVIAYVANGLLDDRTWEGFFRFAHTVPVRAIFFTATAATAGVMAPLDGSWFEFFLGVGSLVAVAAIALRVAMSQVGWMYDQASARGFDAQSARQMQQRGDFQGLMAERARTGKLRVGRTTWLHRLRVQGPGALIWKEAVLQTRGLKTLISIMGLYVLTLNAVPIVMRHFDARAATEAGYAFLGLQALGAFMMATSIAQTGYLELLKRVDLQKPLPFPSSTIVFAEVIAKALPACMVAGLSATVVLIAVPAMLPYVLAAVIGTPTLAVLMCATTLAVTLLFPDIDDPTQRGFRGLVMLLGMVILGAPAVVVFGLCAGILNWHPALAMLPYAAINVGLSVAVSAFSGNLYSDYNPSE